MGGHPKAACKRKAPLLDDCAIVPLPQDGDCFYKCIARAYASAGLSASDEANETKLNDKENEVKRLRRCVSRRVDDGVFAQFAVAHQAGLDDYAFMRRLPDAAALRVKLCVSGAESGATRCVWANEFEIATLCDVLELTALIVDEAAPEHSQFVVIPGRDDRRRLQRRCYVVLLRTERAHYNLAAFDDRSLFEGLAQVPKHVRDTFGLPAADRRAAPRAPRSRRGPPQSPLSPVLEPVPFSDNDAEPSACPGCGRTFSSVRARSAHQGQSPRCRQGAVARRSTTAQPKATTRKATPRKKPEAPPAPSPAAAARPKRARRAAAPFPVDTLVEARWRNGRVYYPAVVVATVTGDKKITVKYADDGSTETLPVTRVREMAPRRRSVVTPAPALPAAPARKPGAAFRAFEERWERRASRKRSAAAEAQLLAKYGGREFRDDDGAYVICPDNLEWCGGEWTVLARKKQASKRTEEEYEGYVVNVQLRRMIARVLPTGAVQRK